MSDMSNLPAVWVFNGAGGEFPSAIFSRRELAEVWIAKNRLTGTLTLYPVDVAVYDLEVARGFFKVEKDQHRQPEFIGRFSSAHQEHYHYEDGLLWGRGRVGGDEAATTDAETEPSREGRDTG